MVRKRFRILSTLLALCFATGIVLFLSYAGKKSKGPIEDLVTGASEAVQKVEDDIIISQREDKRSDKLEWLKAYKRDINKLRNPSGILLGAFDNNNTESFESTINLEDTLKTTFPLIHIYTAWGTKQDQQFPELQVKAILEMGSIPVITWEPWLSAFESDKFPGLRPSDKRDLGGMIDISNGKYDSYLKKWARMAAKINEPIFLRFGHEMNDPYRYPWGPQNNSAKDFVAAWQHVHNVFKQQGANKILWVWSPHPAYGFFDAFYPGSNYVDYVGVGTLNYGTVASWSQWWSFGEIFGRHYKELAVFNKPIILTEFASLKVGGKRSQWYADALHQLPKKFPFVKSILFFHYSDDKTTTQQVINWYIIHDTSVIKTIINEVALWNQAV